MSFRASLVDDFIAEGTISALVDTRVFDMFFEFEDFLNSKANAISSFPAITIESDTGETENNLDSHDNLIHETLSITIYQQVNLQKLRSRQQTVRNKERDTKRQVDTVADAITAYILDKRGVIDAAYYIRSSHISSDSDGVFETEGNREIVTRELSYVVTYSNIIPVSVNTAIPVVTGDVAVDDLLTTTNGTWTNSPISFTYRWLRDDVAISGATSQTYTIVSADEETEIKSEVKAVNAGGSSLPAESVGTEIPASGFNMTVDTTQAGSASDTMILPYAGGNTTDWGDGTINTSNTHTYAVGGVKSISIAGVVTGFRFANGGDKSKLITVPNTGELVIDNSAMFQGCGNLTDWVNNSGVLVTTTSMLNMFHNCGSLTSLDVSSFDTSLVVNMISMFSGCSSLTSLTGVEDFDTSLVTNMGSMFSGCSSLTALDVSSWVTPLVTNTSNMFNGCSSLTALDLSSFNTSLVTNMSNMFRGCVSLTSLDLSSFDTSLVTNMDSMFIASTSLTSLIGVEDFDITSVTNMSNFLTTVTLPTAQYSELLVNYEALKNGNTFNFHGGSSKYTAGAAATARTDWIASGVTITDGGQE